MYEELTERVLKNIFVELEASGRHVHVTREQAQTLFGHPLTEKRPLSQPGQFLANERLTVVGPKGEFRNVAVLGPERKEAQVEISLTDGKVLGITPPVQLSGNVENSPGAVLIGPAGQVVLGKGVIAAQRHIHMTPEDAQKFGVKDKQVVKLQVCGSARILPPSCIWITMRPMPAASKTATWGGSYCEGAAHWRCPWVSPGVRICEGSAL